MATRASTRRRKPGVAVTTNARRQPLLRSESAAAPKGSEIHLKPKATVGAEAGGLAEGSYNTYQEPGLIDKSAKVQVAVGVHEELMPSQNQTHVVSNRRVQHRVWVEPNMELETSAEVHATMKPSYSELLQTLKNLRHLNKSRQRMTMSGEMKPKLKNNLLVPKSLKFDGTAAEFHCRFAIQNTSERFLTYVVKSTSLSKFEVTPSIGWISPKSKAKIEIKTRWRYVQNSGDISCERFVVFAAPIFSEQQLVLEKLQIYWRAFGSTMFPRWVAEVHCIDTLSVPSMGISIIDSVVANNQTWKELEHNFGPVDSDTLHTIWEVHRSTWTQNLSLECQYLEFRRNANLNEKNKKATDVLMSFKTGLLIVVPVILFFTWATVSGVALPFGIQLVQFFKDWVFGPILAFLFPPPPPWYESLYFWRWIKKLFS